MTFPKYLRNLITWVDQPMPDKLSDMHTVVFRLERQVDEIRLAFNGQLLLVPKGTGPHASERFARLRGSGFVQHPDLLDEPESTREHVSKFGGWVRCVVDLTDTGLVTTSFQSWAPGMPEDAGQPLEFEWEPKVLYVDDGGVVLGLGDGWSALLRPSTAAPG